VPAIALTAFSRKQDVDQALAAGFDAHCAKPLRPLELLRTIARVARLNERAGKPATS
jgi:CheY-like chemotaxis protein